MALLFSDKNNNNIKIVLSLKTIKQIKQKTICI